MLLGELCKAIPKSQREAVDELVGILPKMRAAAELLVTHDGVKALADVQRSASDTALGNLAI